MPDHVLVIGGSGGIGSGIVEVLENNGYDVVSTYYNNRNHHSRNYKKLDLLNLKDIDSFDFSIYRAIIFSAGQEALSTLSAINKDEFDNQISAQLYAPLMIVKRVLSGENKLKHIIFISSKAGLRLYESSGLYALIKASVLSLTRLLANELKKKYISVNAIAPNWCETLMADRVIDKKGLIKKEIMENMIDNEFIQPKEIGLLCYKLLDTSINITGQVIEVDSSCKKQEVKNV